MRVFFRLSPESTTERTNMEGKKFALPGPHYRSVSVPKPDNLVNLRFNVFFVEVLAEATLNNK